MRIETCAIASLLVLTMLPAMAAAEVTRVDVVSRRDVLAGRAFGTTGAYEVIVGKIHFVIDPANPRNRVVIDLDKAPRNAAGQVELTADLSILKPKDLVQGNGVALIDIVNRGRKTVLAGFNRAAASADLSTEAEFGDGLLMRQGFTIVWVGWEFDVPRRDGVVRLDVPIATGTTGLVRAYFTPDARRADFAVVDLSSYSPKEPAALTNTLTVRDGAQGTPATIPREKWQLAGNVVTLEGGFEPGSGSSRCATRPHGSSTRAMRRPLPSMPMPSARRRAAASCAISCTKASIATRRTVRCSMRCSRTSRARRGST
jgi:hypothetical protein